MKIAPTLPVIYKILSVDEERKLFTEYKNAQGEDKLKIRNKIAEHYSRLIPYTTNKYFPKVSDGVIARDDLISNGVLVLYKTIDCFDVNKGIRFRNYLVQSLINDTKMLLGRERGCIRRTNHAITHEFNVPVAVRMKEDFDCAGKSKELALEDKELAKIIIKESGRLAPKEQLVFALKVLGDKTFQEIGEILGRSKMVAQRLFARAVFNIQGNIRA